MEINIKEDTIKILDKNGAWVKLNQVQYKGLKKSGMLWEFYPNAPACWPYSESNTKTKNKANKSSKIPNLIPSRKFQLINPTFQVLIAAYREHVPECNDFWYPDYSATTVLSNYNYVLMANPGTKVPYRIEIKCKGLGCKSRKTIGIGEGKSLEEAAMIALLRANNVEVIFNDKN